MIIVNRYYRLLLVALNDPDQWLAVIKYLDSKGKATERTISPLRLTDEHCSAYCLGRDALRTFRLDRIIQVRLAMAFNVLTPEERVRYLSRRLPSSCGADKSTETSQGDHAG